MKRILSTIILLGFSLQLFAASSIEQDYKDRLQKVLAWADTCDEKNHLVAAARVYNQNEHHSGIDMWQELINRYQNAPVGMFQIYSLMIGYCSVKDQLPDSLKTAIRDYMATANFYRGDTENHLTMYYSGLYLAAQEFADLPADKWYTGKPSAENKTEAENWLRSWMDLTFTKGQGEFDSPTYMSVFISPMMGLYQYCKDPLLKKKTKAMLYWLITDFAVDHLDGMYVGAHSREYPERLILQNHPESLMSYWAWLFFDSIEKPVFNHQLLTAALSDFVLPDLLYKIGTDRSEPYVHTETKRVRHILRLGDKKNPPVFKYTYMTKDFALGSMMGGGILQPIQQHIWDISYVSKGMYGTLFTVHPYIGADDMGMFFPEEMKFSRDMVVNHHTYYGKEGKWASSSPYVQTFQHKDAIIVLYNIPKGTKFPHIDGFFPKDLAVREEDPSGWIFCRDGNTFIAFFPLQPYEWIEEEHGFRLRSYDLKNGCILQAGQARQFASFDAFKSKVRSQNLAHDTFEQSLTVSYTTLNNDVMTFTYDGPRRLNGNLVDFEDYTLFNGPYAQSEIDSKVLHIRHEDQGLVLDLRNDQKPLFLPEIKIAKIEEPVRISGKLDDPAWKKARPLPLRDAVSGKPGRYETTAYLMYDHRYLYAGFVCEDDQITSTITDRDGPMYNEECVELFLDLDNDPHFYYEFEINPLNAVLDAVILNPKTILNDQDPVRTLTAFDVNLTHAAFIDKKNNRWSAELAIPLYELPDFQPDQAAEGNWRINLYRIDSQQEKPLHLYAWAKVDKRDFHLPWHFGYIRFWKTGQNLYPMVK